MKITVTFTIPKAGKSYDIQMLETQKIEETLRVLQNNIRSFQDIDVIYSVREKRNGRHINMECTYEEAGIYSGSELLINV